MNTFKTTFFDSNDDKVANLRLLLESIKKYGYEARIVGGAVRNFLLGMPMDDFDLTTTALPSEILDMAMRENWKIKTTNGIKFGTVVINFRAKNYEITTLREDVKNFGRYADVNFIKDFEQDSMRRDFTVNAMCVDCNSILYDYHNGTVDAAHKKIKFIGDPKRRIKEDYLRILRYFRFAALYGDGNVDENYVQIIDASVYGLDAISGEKIMAEFLKILSAESFPKIVPPMQKILKQLFNVDYEKLQAHLKTIQEAKSNMKLIEFLKCSKSDPEQLIKRYHFSKKYLPQIKNGIAN